MLGVIIATALAAQAAVSPSEADIGEALGVLEAAWIEGDFDAFALAGRDAVDLIEQSNCPMRQDVTIAAFMAGVGARRSRVQASSTYLFWVASETDKRFEVLGIAARAVADAQRGSPGQSIRDDVSFMRTPYRTASHEIGCADNVLDPALLSAEPRNPSRVFVAIGWPREEGEQIRRTGRFVYGFPGEEGEALAAQIIDSDERVTPGARVSAYVFDPCAILGRRDYNVDNICRAKD